MVRAKDIMTREVITVTEDMTVERLGRIFIDKGISGAPVVGSDGSLVGIVTENDLISKNSRLHIPTILRLFDAFIPLGASRLEEEIKKMTAATVGEICTRRAVTVGEETPLDEISTIMRDKKIHLLPVMREGKMVGIIGKKNLMRGIAGEVAQ